MRMLFLANCFGTSLKKLYEWFSFIFFQVFNRTTSKSAFSNLDFLNNHALKWIASENRRLTTSAEINMSLRTRRMLLGIVLESIWGFWNFRGSVGVLPGAT